MFSILQIFPDMYRTKIIETAGFGETLAFGAEMLLIGMATVFAVLTLLWGCLAVFKVVFYDLKQKKTNSVSAADQTAVENSIEENSDEEIVAVIAAAIAMAQEEQPNLKFRVVSFNRK